MSHKQAKDTLCQVDSELRNTDIIKCRIKFQSCCFPDILFRGKSVRSLLLSADSVETIHTHFENYLKRHVLYITWLQVTDLHTGKIYEAGEFCA